MKVKRSPTWKGEGSVPQIVQLWIPFRPHKNTHIYIKGCELVLSPSLLPQNELGSCGFPSHKTSCKRMHDDFISEVGFTSQWFSAQLFAFQLCLCSSHLLSSLPQHLFFFLGKASLISKVAQFLFSRFLCTFMLVVDRLQLYTNLFSFFPLIKVKNKFIFK